MKILILNFQRTGDIIQTFHIVNSIIRTSPDSRIFYLTNNIHASSLKLIEEYIEEFIAIDYFTLYQNFKNNKISKGFIYLKNILRKLKENKFDRVINLNFSRLGAIVASLLSDDVIGAQLKNSGEIKIENRYFKELFLNLENPNFKVNLIEMLLRGLGLPYFPSVSIKDYSNREKFKVILHPGASREEKKWGIENFTQLTKLIFNYFKGNAEFYITGSKSEAGENQKICESLKTCGIKIENLSGKKDLLELKNLIQNSDILISGDTSIAHLASLTKITIVTIFLGNAYHFHTYPYSPDNIVIFPDIKCYPCNANFICKEQKCKKCITPEIVFKAISNQLQNNVMRTFLSKDGYVKLGDIKVVRSL